MIFCNKVVYYCQQCGQYLINGYHEESYENYGLYLCNKNCFRDFRSMRRLSWWIRLIGKSRNRKGRNRYVATR